MRPQRRDNDVGGAQVGSQQCGGRDDRPGPYRPGQILPRETNGTAQEVDGGTHLQGFRAALTTLVNKYAREKNLLKEKDDNLTGDDIREGLTAVISVPGAPRKGELRGRLFGPSGDELAVYWNAPVRDGYDKAFGDWRAVMNYVVCPTCTG